jgi:hypothetical protein
MPLTVVVDNANLQKAKKVQHWMAAHPRFELLELPTYCPAAHPMERAGGEVHDKGTRNHPRTRLWPRGGEVKHSSNSRLHLKACKMGMGAREFLRFATLSGCDRSRV